MGISSSLNAGVSGLNANANKLATISDNIANSQTYGYKRADVDFSSIAISDSKSPNTVGGGRWFNAGGVRTGAIWDVDAKGQLVSTSNSTDIAITGRGFLPVTSTSAVSTAKTAADLPFMLTSTGSFKTDKDGFLTTDSGLTLLGWPADNNGKVAQQPRDTSNGLVPVHINTSAVAMEPTANIGLNVNLPTDDVTAGASGDARTVTIQYYDNVGAAQTLSVTLTPTVPATGRSNQWTMEITDNASGTSLGTGTLTFNDAPPNAGGLASFTGGLAGTWDSATGNLALGLGGGQTITMAMGSTDPTVANHLTQTASTFSSSGVSHDGNAAGTFTGLSIDANGNLSATYSTGFSKVLYQVPVADVPNPDGLTVLDNQCFALSPSSGNMFLWDAGTGPVGATEGFARETSTTDIADELTQLIQTQRAYSSNAKIIQTVDEMLQETTNLKR
ncbi:MAG: flagellar hook-basal body complex protein [Amaricoccus sp.]